jgi:hypothetical protein
MFKIRSHYSFGYLKHKLLGRESNYQFDPIPLKVKNHPDLLVCRWHATYHWKALNEGFGQFEVSTRSYGPPKSWEFQFREFRDSQVGSPKTK